MIDDTPDGRTLEARVEAAARHRFDDRPVYRIGDYLPPVEGVWSVKGRTIVETSSDPADPDAPILARGYPVSRPGFVWYILFLTLASSSPQRARAYMGRRRCLTYWPRETAALIRGRGDNRKLVAVTRPLFSGYALLHAPVGVAPEDLVDKVEGRVHGISGFVLMAGLPVVVPDVMVERIVERERSGEFDHADRSGRKVTPKLFDWMIEGGLVIVDSGPFRSFTGVIETVDREAQRIKVAVSIFGRATPVELDLVDVRKP